MLECPGTFRDPESPITSNNSPLGPSHDGNWFESRSPPGPALRGMCFVSRN